MYVVSWRKPKLREVTQIAQSYMVKQGQGFDGKPCLSTWRAQAHNHYTALPPIQEDEGR